MKIGLIPVNIGVPNVAAMTGLAQLAATDGHSVMLFDAEPGVANSAKENLLKVFAKLSPKGKFSAQSATQTLDLIEPIEDLDSAVNVGVAVEAIIEDIEIKRSLFQQLIKLSIGTPRQRPQIILRKNQSCDQACS